MSRVDLVIPTYNGREPLRACLESVRKQTLSDVHVIVVDDGSTDDTGEMISRDFPEVDYLPLRGNRGFAAACNAGIARGSAEYVALLNNDAFPDPEWLERLIAGIERHPVAAAAASKILLADGTDRLHAAGDSFSWRGLPGNRGVWEQAEGQFDREEEVFSACAAAALYRRGPLDEVASVSGDIFDPDFFMYCEDVDLAWRLRLLGYSIVYLPDARVEHQLSATGGGPLASYYVARNCFAVLAKNLPPGLGRQIWRRFLGHQLRQLVTALRHIREPAARAQLRGILAGARFALRQRSKRRSIQQARRIDASEVSASLIDR